MQSVSQVEQSAIVSQKKKNSCTNWLIFINILLSFIILFNIFERVENGNKSLPVQPVQQAEQTKVEKKVIQMNNITCPSQTQIIEKYKAKKQLQKAKEVISQQKPKQNLVKESKKSNQQLSKKQNITIPETQKTNPSWQKLQSQKDQKKGSQKAFETIYAKNVWGPAAHPSGPGSIPQKRIDYLLLVQYLVAHPKITKIVEVGFGDFQLSGRIRIPPNKTYHGYDVVKKLLRPNETNRFFTIIKSIHEFNQTGDLLLCKQVMQHWPNDQIDYFMKNVVPKFKYSLLTNDWTAAKQRRNIQFGQYALMNLDDYNPKVVVSDVERGCYLIPGWPE